MQLLTSLTSPFSRITRIVHRIHNLEVEEVIVNPWQDRSPLAGKNAISKIPVLVLDDETPIIDSWVICEYFDSLASKPLIPSEKLARLKMQSNCALVHDAINTGTIIIGTTMIKETLPQKVIDWHIQKIKDCLGEINNLYTKQEFGDLNNLNMLDVCVVGLLGFINFRMQELINLENEVPSLSKWYSQICAEDAVIKATIPRLPK